MKLIPLFSVCILTVDVLRVYIVVCVYQIINREPSFADGITHNKAVLFSWQMDEVILLFGHFMHLLLFPLLFALLYYWRAEVGIRRYVIIVLGLFFFEIFIRNVTAYAYIMYD